MKTLLLTLILASFVFSEDADVYSLNTIESHLTPKVIVKKDTIVSRVFTKDTLVIVKNNTNTQVIQQKVIVNKSVTKVNLDLGDVGKSFENWFNSKQPSAKKHKKPKVKHPEEEFIE